jgi:sulfate/thiosulfate transport system substrate-binding protein
MKNALINKIFLFIAILLLLLLNISCNKTSENKQQKEVTLLNVSYDPTREFYRDFNRAFNIYWKNKTGIDVHINQSHGGSGKQARAVINGLEADVVTLALAYDIEEISKAGLIDKNWQNEYSHNSSPYTSVIVFLVRKGNPKNIKEWDDLARNDVSVITPNPKTSGGARWNYLSAWAYAKKKFDNDEKKIRDFISRILANVPVFNIGARGSANTFIQNNIGDVLIAWENEALLVTREAMKNDYEIIYPSLSMLSPASDML